MNLKGLYTAVVTPFDAEGNIDHEGLRRNLRYQLTHGVDGIVIFGTTGEAPTLTAPEKEYIIEIAVEEVKGRAALLVGTGSYSTAQTIASNRQAQEWGADGALIVCPYYNKPTQEGIYRHFSAICEAVSLPICIYNHPGRCGQNLQTETLKRLAKIPSIIGVKEASGCISQMNEILEVILKDRPDFCVVSGDDSLTLPLMALGGHGVISVVSNLVPGPIKELVQACLKDDFVKARDWNSRLFPLFKAAFIETNPIPIKTAMQYCGMAAGPCRLPLSDLMPGSRHQLIEILKTLPSSWLGGYGQA